LSIDAVVARLLHSEAPAAPNADLVAWGLGALAVGLPLAMLLPVFGLGLAAMGILLLGVSRWLHV
jgi:putative oxidoreductase